MVEGGIVIGSDSFFIPSQMFVFLYSEQENYLFEGRGGRGIPKKSKIQPLVLISNSSDTSVE